MPNPVEDAAREWLTRFVGMYAGMDMGEGDPVHVARIQAQAFLDAGPTPGHPFTVCLTMINALPHDRRAVDLAQNWCNEYLGALDELDAT